MNCPKIRFISFIVRKVMKVNNERTSGFRQAHAFLINKIPYFHGFIHKILNFVPNGQYVYSASDLGTKISEPQLSAITSRFPGVRHNLKVPGCRILPQDSQFSAITSRFPVVRYYFIISKPSSSMRRDGRIDRPNETNSRSSQFCEHALRI